MCSPEARIKEAWSPRSELLSSPSHRVWELQGPLGFGFGKWGVCRDEGGSELGRNMAKYCKLLVKR